MLKGLPDLGLYVADLLARRPLRGPLGVVIFHHLGDLVNAAHLAMTHYFPISLDRHYLQGSSIGSPYQKWARFTNEDFRQVDECLRRLLVATSRYYFDSNNRDAYEEIATLKDAWIWFTGTATGYACCRVDRDAPRLTRSALHVERYVDWQSTRFLNLWNRPSARGEPGPFEAVTEETVDIEDRSVVTRLHREGLERLAGLRHVHAGLAAYLRATLKTADVTAPHEGTLSSDRIGVILRPGVDSD